MIRILHSHILVMETTNTFAIPSGNNMHTILVFLNGVCQVPGSDYVVTGNNCDFSVSSAPKVGDTIQIRQLPL